MVVRMLALSAVFTMAACHSRLHASDLPAVLTTSTPESRAELVNVVSKALNGSEALLADDALMKSSSLIVERKQRRDIQGRIGSGRLTDLPERFELVINGSRCVLILKRDESRTVLKKAKCKAL